MGLFFEFLFSLKSTNEIALKMKKEKEIKKTRRYTRMIVLYGWKVNVQEQNEIVGELHIPRENFTFPRS